MSKRWEEAIEDWYNNRSHLDYLDLAKVNTPTTKDLAHNISVIYDRLNLQSRVAIKNQNLVIEELVKINESLHNLEKAVQILQKGKLPELPTNFIEGLSKLKISEPKPREQGQLRVFKDLYIILKEQQQKLKEK